MKVTPETLKLLGLAENASEDDLNRRLAELAAPKAEPELENTEPTLDGGEAPAPRVVRRVVRRPAAKGRPVTRRA